MGKCLRDALHTHTRHTHTLQHMQQFVPGRTPQSLHDSLGERRDTSLASVVPSLRPTCERPPPLPLTSASAQYTTPRTTSRFPPCPPASSPHKRHPNAEPMAVYTWEGGWAVHGRGGEQKPHRERGTQKEGNASRASEEAARYTDRPNPLSCLSNNQRRDRQRATTKDQHTKTIDSRCSIQA